MASFTKDALSGSTHFRGIKVAATSIGSGDTIHTAGNGTTSAGPEDVLTLYAFNSDTQTRTLTLGWGGTTDPDDLIKTPIPPGAGLIMVVDRLPLRNSLVVKAAADAANKIIVFGWYDRIA